MKHYLLHLSLALAYISPGAFAGEADDRVKTLELRVKALEVENAQLKEKITGMVRSGSMHNLTEIGHALLKYADFPGRGSAPDEAVNLFPALSGDPKVIINPAYPDRDVGYIYVAGHDLRVPDANYILAYEDVPAERAAEGRMALMETGEVKWLTDEEFRHELKRAEASIENRGKAMNLVSLSRKALDDKIRSRQ